MKPADVFCDCGCGRLVVQPRGGGPRKRFFENACRARWTRKGKTKQPARRRVTEPVDDRQRTLELIYEQLKADILERGSVVGGRPNPVVESIRKVIADLDRRTPAAEEEEPEVIASLHAI